MNEDERAELIAALHQSAEMIGGLLDLTDRLIEALESHARPSAEQIGALRAQAWSWRQQLDRVRQRLASVCFAPGPDLSRDDLTARPPGTVLRLTVTSS